MHDPASGFEFSPPEGHGPEDVLRLPDGSHLTGIEDGRILRISPDFRAVETLCNTGGRPLGLELLPDGAVLVCDAAAGLLRVDPATGGIESLAERIGNTPLGLCNNAAVAGDGTVYFSASSTRHPIARADIDIAEARPTGRLLRRAPDGTVNVLREGLYFANGVVLAPDESHVLVAETGAARIARHWLTGPRAGQNDVFADDLPGLPDNLNIGSDGLIWAALVAPSAPLRKLRALPYPARWFIARLMSRLAPPPPRDLHVMALGFDGRVAADVAMRDAPYHFVTSVREDAGMLYLCSIRENRVARVPVATFRPLGA